MGAYLLLKVPPLLKRLYPGCFHLRANLKQTACPEQSWPLKYTHTHTICLNLSASPPLPPPNTFLPFSCPSHMQVSPLHATPTSEPGCRENDPLEGLAAHTAPLQILSVLLQLNFSSLCAAFLESPPTPLLTSCTLAAPPPSRPRKQGRHCLYEITGGLLVIEPQGLH